MADHSMGHVSGPELLTQALFGPSDSSKPSLTMNSVSDAISERLHQQTGTPSTQLGQQHYHLNQQMHQQHHQSQHGKTRNFNDNGGVGVTAPSRAPQMNRIASWYVVWRRLSCLLSRCHDAIYHRVVIYHRHRAVIYHRAVICHRAVIIIVL
jgi:hypothetical protein